MLKNFDTYLAECRLEDHIRFAAHLIALNNFPVQDLEEWYSEEGVNLSHDQLTEAGNFWGDAWKSAVTGAGYGAAGGLPGGLAGAAAGGVLGGLAGGLYGVGKNLYNRWQQNKNPAGYQQKQYDTSLKQALTSLQNLKHISNQAGNTHLDSMLQGLIDQLQQIPNVGAVQPQAAAAPGQTQAQAQQNSPPAPTAPQDPKFDATKAQAKGVTYDQWHTTALQYMNQGLDWDDAASAASKQHQIEWFERCAFRERFLAEVKRPEK